MAWFRCGGSDTSDLETQLNNLKNQLQEAQNVIAGLQQQVITSDNILNVFTVKKSIFAESSTKDGNFINETYRATRNVEALYITVGRSVKNHDNSSRGIIIVTIRKNGTVLYESRDHVNDFGGGRVYLEQTIKINKGDNVEVTRESYDLDTTYFNDTCVIVGIASLA